MHRNYLPYLKCSEFDDEYKSNYFNTENEFFEIQKNYNSHETINKNYNNNAKRHLSEYEEIIPQDYMENETETIFCNNIIPEKNGFSGRKNNFGFSLKNIHFNDINYRKYISNLKTEGNQSKTRKINKKNNILNKNAPNFETYNIIQIYEAPPLELSPIMEVEKIEEGRKPPKYYRKKIIYSLEDENEKNSEDNIIDSKLNYSKYLRRSKLSNSKINKELIDNNPIKEKEEKNNKNYIRYLTKENINTKNENKINNDITSYNNRRDFKRFIKYDKEIENASKYMDSTDDATKINKKDGNLLKSQKQENEKEIDNKLNDKEVSKKIKKKNYVSQRNNRNSIKLEEITKIKQNIQDIRKEDSKNDSNNEKNKTNNGIKIRNSFIEKNINISDNKDENIINKNNKSKRNLVIFNKDKLLKEENKLENNSLSTKLEKHIDNDEQKMNENKNYNHVKNKYSYWNTKAKENEIIKNITNKNKIDEDKNQISNNKRNYLKRKIEKEGTSMKNIKSNKKNDELYNNNISNNNNKNNNYSKYVYSFSVEKKSPNEMKTKNQIDRQKNENKEKEQKKIYDFKNQIKNENNSQFMTIYSKKDLDSKKEIKFDNKDKLKKEINIKQINNTNLSNVEKNNYNYIISLNLSNKKGDETNKSKNNNTKENSPKKVISKNNEDKYKNNNNKINNVIINEAIKLKRDTNLEKENNLKTLNTTTKSINRNNYLIMKNSTDKNKSTLEKREKPNEINDINNKELRNNIKNISTNNKLDTKEVFTNLSSSNVIKNNPNNNINSLNKSIKDIDKKPTNENNKNNNNNNLSKKMPTIDIDEKKEQTSQNEEKQKKNRETGQVCNHSIKISYGSTTLKIPKDKKDKEGERKDSNNNINIINDVNLKSKYSNYKINININSSNNKNNEKKNNNATIENNNITDKTIKEVKHKNNHTLYVSINSKK